MKLLFFRAYMLLAMLIMSLTAHAQYGEEVNPLGKRKDDDFKMEDAVDVGYMPIHIGFSDIFMVVCLLIACYVFGKIWKGCSYLLLILAALLYYLTRY